MSRPFFRDLVEPSLVEWEGAICEICQAEIMPGEHVFNISLDPFADGGGDFVKCCSHDCVNHAIEDDADGCHGK